MQFTCLTLQAININDPTDYLKSVIRHTIPSVTNVTVQVK